MSTLLLFDLDGTLLNTLQDIADSVNHTLSVYGCPGRTLEQIRSFVGNGARKLIARALPGTPADPDVDGVLQTYLTYYAAHNQDATAPYSGIKEMLDMLKDYSIGIVSNKSHADVAALCAKFFPGLYALGEQVGCPRKPAPDMLLKTMHHFACDRCIYIGDSEVDIQTAKNAGVPCISVTWGFRNRQQLQQAGATCLCDRPCDLPALIKECSSCPQTIKF